MLKVIEVLAESTKSWEDAAAQAVATASKTIRNIKSIYIENFEATVENGKDGQVPDQCEDFICFGMIAFCE